MVERRRLLARVCALAVDMLGTGLFRSRRCRWRPVDRVRLAQLMEDAAFAAYGWAHNAGAVRQPLG